MIERLELSAVKKHLRVDHDEEDDLIKGLIDSAKSRCVAYLNRDVFETAEALQTAVAQGRELKHPIVIEPHHEQAILLLVGDWYHNREAIVSDKAGLPMVVESLLKPDRIRGV